MVAMCTIAFLSVSWGAAITTSGMTTIARIANKVNFFILTPFCFFFL
jgi:hypothetical protein